MKQALLSALLLTTTCAAPLHARIGETEAQISTRYGTTYTPEEKQHREHGEIQCEYRVNDFLIVVTFVKSKSYCEKYSHVDASPLTDAEIGALLKANSTGGNVEKDGGVEEQKMSGPCRWTITKEARLLASAACDEHRKSLTIRQEYGGDMSIF